MLTDRELEIVNSVSTTKFKTDKEIIALSKEKILDLTDLLGGLIGYDATIGDIDALGLEADNIISKLLIMLEKRGEM